MDQEEVKILTDEELESYFVGDSLKLYLHEIRKYPLLSDEEVRELFIQYKNGSINAYHKLINCNQRLVISIASKYKNQLSNMQFLDLIQEGNLGLVKAIERFDVTKDNKFGTYATWWIYQAISRSIVNKDAVIRLPESLKNDIIKYKKLLDSCEKKGQDLPSKEEICDILNISKKRLEQIKDILSKSIISFDQTIDDDRKSEVGDFIADTNSDYEEKIMDKMLETEIFVVLKEILMPFEYYLIYYRVLNDKKKTYRELASDFRLSQEGIRLLEQKILKKLKPYFENDYEKLGETYKKILEKSKYPAEKINIKIIEPQEIVIYLYVKEDLNSTLQNVLFLKMFGKYNLTLEERSKELNLSVTELENAEKNIQDIINKKMRQITKFRQYKNDMLMTYGRKIYELALRDKENLIDYNYLNEKYVSLTFREIIDLFGDEYLNLNVSERKLLERFYDKNDYNIIPYYQIEQEVNLQKFGFKHSNKNVPLNKLYQTYLDNVSEFSEDKRLYLECFIFNKRDKNDFLCKYSLKDLRRLKFYLINKLEKMYYGISSFSFLQFTKEKYLKIKRMYSGKIPLEKEKILDLYYGVINRCYSIGEMAEIFQTDYITMHHRLRDARDAVLALYGKKRIIKLDIDKEVYAPYILNKRYEFTDEAREVLELYIINDFTYEEIVSYFADKYNVNLTKTRISNIVTENIRRIDYYRFHIIEPVFDVRNNLEDFYKIYSDNFNDEDKQIIDLRFIEYVPSAKIVNEYGFSKEIVKRVVDKFGRLYIVFLTNSVKVYDSDVVSELNRAKVDEILDEKEKQILSLFYGIKNKYNEKGEKYLSLEITKIMNISMNNYYHGYYSAHNKIKQRKVGILRGECAFIEREELVKALEDKHLPISDKEKDIISSLYEINTSYKSLEELSVIYGDTPNSIKRRCQRAFVSINKYLNGEIEGTISYESDVLPNFRYFSKSERILLTEKYKNGLSYREVSKKYDTTFDRVVTIYNRLQNTLAEILNEPTFKALDFEKCEEAFNSDKLPFYGDIDLAKNIFDDYFAMNNFVRLNAQEIIDKYDLKVKPQAVVNFLNLFILSVYKYYDGYRKDKDFTYNEILDYYNKYSNEMPIERKKIYDKYFRRYKKRTNSISALVNHVILFDLIRDKYDDCFRIGNARKEDVMNILREYSNVLTKRTKESLMMLFDISERTMMNGKDINHVYRLLDKLDKKLKKEQGGKLSLKKD